MNMLDFTVLKMPLDLVQAVLEMPEWNKQAEGRVAGHIKSPIRNSGIAWASFDSPLFQAIEEFGRIANKVFMYENFKNDVESIQFTTYTEGQHYSWHTDKGSLMHTFHHKRRLSLTVQLTDPAEYEGGALQFDFGDGDKHEMIRHQGAVIVFPSYVMHRVTPVTKGVRKSIVSWIR